MYFLRYATKCKLAIFNFRKIFIKFYALSMNIFHFDSLLFAFYSWCTIEIVIYGYNLLTVWYSEKNFGLSSKIQLQQTKILKVWCLLEAKLCTILCGNYVKIFRKLKMANLRFVEYLKKYKSYLNKLDIFTNLVLCSLKWCIFEICTTNMQREI